MSLRSWMHIIFPGRAFFNSLRQSQYINHAGAEFLASSAVGHVTPRRHVTLSDTVWQTFDASLVAGMSDQRILSLFTVGFFGGFVFGIEGLLLRAGGWRVLPVHFSTFPRNSQTPGGIWKSADIPRDGLCSTGTSLFGTFQLLDKHIAEPLTYQTSYADYAFGSDKYSFAGCHRFSITRLSPDPAAEVGLNQSGQQIQISLEGFICNPKREDQSMPRIGKWFHSYYAKALFANGVQAVLDH